MRIAIDLAAALRGRLRRRARERAGSVSTVPVEVAARDLTSRGRPSVITTDPRSGLPVIDIGRTVTQEEVDEALDEE